MSSANQTQILKLLGEGPIIVVLITISETLWQEKILIVKLEDAISIIISFSHTMIKH